MPTTHTVVQGEYLSQIADRYGFQSYKTIWNDPGNATLKAQRQNPNVLLPGDQLVIPDKTTKDQSVAANARHEFVAPSEKLTLRLVVHDESGKPVANAKCRLDVDSDSFNLVTDGQGQVEKPIPDDTTTGRLVLTRADPPLQLDLPIDVGSLDPLDTVTGQIGRLNNLGYDAGVVQQPADDAAQQQFESAVEEFQCDQQLTVDGIAGPQTQAKLKAVHGC
jgi:hypothetical protein